MNQIQKLLRTNKILLALATLLLLMWLARSLATGSIKFYGFIGWNMFLATVPLLLEQVMKKAKENKNILFKKVSKVILGISWVLFLPNAFYILTDFMHLNPGVLVNERQNEFSAGVNYIRGDGLFVLDSLVVIAATLFGAFVGGLALAHLYKFIQKRNKDLIIPVMSSVLLLSAVGVYIGRFARWNSWEALYRPFSVAVDLIDSLTQAVNRERFMYVVLTMVVFQIMSFLTVLWLSEWSLNKEEKENE